MTGGLSGRGFHPRKLSEVPVRPNMSNEKSPVFADLFMTFFCYEIYLQFTQIKILESGRIFFGEREGSDVRCEGE